MSEMQKPFCPECEGPAEALDRRDFIRVVSAGTAVAAAGTVAPPVRAHPAAAVTQAPARQAKPAEGLIQELYNSMTADQRRTLVLPWNSPLRKRMVNAAHQGQRIGEHYTRAQ